MVRHDLVVKHVLVALPLVLNELLLRLNLLILILGYLVHNFLFVHFVVHDPVLLALVGFHLFLDSHEHLQLFALLYLCLFEFLADLRNLSFLVNLLLVVKVNQVLFELGFDYVAVIPIIFTIILHLKVFKPRIIILFINRLLILLLPNLVLSVHHILIVSQFFLLFELFLFSHVVLELQRVYLPLMNGINALLFLFGLLILKALKDKGVISNFFCNLCLPELLYLFLV